MRARVVSFAEKSFAFKQPQSHWSKGLDHNLLMLTSEWTESCCWGRKKKLVCSVFWEEKLEIDVTLCLFEYFSLKKKFDCKDNYLSKSVREKRGHQIYNELTKYQSGLPQSSRGGIFFMPLKNERVHCLTGEWVVLEVRERRDQELLPS